MSMQRWFAHAETRARAPKDSHSHPRSPSFLHLKGAFVPKRHFCSVFTAGLLRDSDPAGREGVGVGLGGVPDLPPPHLRPAPAASRTGRTAGRLEPDVGACSFFFQHLPHQPVANGDLRRRAAPRVPPPRRRLYSTVVCVCSEPRQRIVTCRVLPFRSLLALLGAGFRWLLRPCFLSEV